MKVFISLFIFYWCHLSYAGMQHHLILKNDFNRDGRADRVVFASYGISGFFQSTQANGKLDTFFIRQGNRSISFIGSKKLGGPYLKLTESVGFISVITLMEYKDNVFKHLVSYALPEKIEFSGDPFSDPFTTSDTSTQSCESNGAFNNKPIKESFSWAEAIKKYSIEEAIKKAINPECKNVFGEKYPQLESEILSACRLSSEKNEKNNLISCLDSSESTKFLGGKYKTLLAANIFDDSFKINCSVSEKATPLASFSTVSKNISIFKVNPDDKNRNFKSDFFHELVHASESISEEDVQKLTKGCMQYKNKSDERVIETSNLSLSREIAAKKDGVEINIPPEVKQMPQTAVANAVAESARTLDGDFSMGNEAQYSALSRVSKATFKSFDPIMKAAYEAAVPTAFAQGTLDSSTNSSSAPVALPTIKSNGTSRGIASEAPFSSPASGVVYDISSQPETLPTLEKGELGNGLSMKAAIINGRGNHAASGGGTETSGGFRHNSLQYIPTTERQDLRNNVPQLKAEEDFVKALVTGTYADVKDRLTDPKNQKILEEKKIQYVARDRTLGSKKPTIVLKDLGNKFSIVRVTIE